MHVFYTNARSLLAKHDELLARISLNYCSIFIITETWFDVTVSDIAICPKDFIVYRRDRGSRGGGLLVGVKNSINSIIVHVSTHFELLAIDVSNDSQSLRLIVAYVPHSEKDFNNL